MPFFIRFHETSANIDDAHNSRANKESISYGLRTILDKKINEHMASVP